MDERKNGYWRVVFGLKMEDSLISFHGLRLSGTGFYKNGTPRPLLARELRPKNDKMEA